LRVAYGSPIETADLAGLAGREPGQASRIATERLRAAITDLERRLGSPPAPADGAAG
jgi:hypothetical protein